MSRLDGISPAKYADAFEANDIDLDLLGQVEQPAFGQVRATAERATGTTMWMPLHMSYLAKAYAQLARFDDARRCIGEAITATETNGERWCEAEINRIAGEIALKSPERDLAKAASYFANSQLHASSRQSPGNFARR